MTTENNEQVFVIMFVQGTPEEVGQMVTKIPESTAIQVPFKIYEQVFSVICKYLFVCDTN